jgi:peptide/nickel transport system permease protein
MRTPRRRRALILPLAFAAVVACADFLSPHHSATQDLDRFFAPPTRIHFFDQHGSFHWRPFIYSHELTDPVDVVYRERKDTMHPVLFLVPGYGYRLLGVVHSNLHVAGVDGEPLHPLGTDELGRDVLARILSGARTSLLVVGLGIAIYAVTGLLLGCAAGMAGGWVDAVLMRFSEFVLAIPSLYLILALRALLPLRLAFVETLFLTSGTVAAVAWPPLARGVRGLVLQLGNAGYVEAARSLGCTRLQLLRNHMLPALSSFALGQAAVAAPVFLLGEVVLSFLDVGFSDSGESWGTMLRNLRDPRVLTDFWWNLAPLVCIFVTLLWLNLLGAGRQGVQPAISIEAQQS